MGKGQLVNKHHTLVNSNQFFTRHDTQEIKLQNRITANQKVLKQYSSLSKLAAYHELVPYLTNASKNAKEIRQQKENLAALEQRLNTRNFYQSTEQSNLIFDRYQQLGNFIYVSSNWKEMATSINKIVDLQEQTNVLEQFKTVYTAIDLAIAHTARRLDIDLSNMQPQAFITKLTEIVKSASRFQQHDIENQASLQPSAQPEVWRTTLAKQALNLYRCVDRMYVLYKKYESEIYSFDEIYEDMVARFAACSAKLTSQAPDADTALAADVTELLNGLQLNDPGYSPPRLGS